VIYRHRDILDKSPIEVSEAKEDLDIPIGLMLRPFLNGFYVGRIYYNTIRYDNKAQKLNVLNIKDIF